MCAYSARLVRCLLSQLVVHSTVLAPELFIRPFERGRHYFLSREAILDGAVCMLRTRKLGQPRVELCAI